LGVERVSTDDEIERAMTEPPPDTRAYFRGRCLAKWADDIVAANWDSLVFDVGSDALRRVPMMEPTRGTEAYVGTLLDECSTAAELLERLGS
jgi:proteasome accessory factor A